MSSATQRFCPVPLIDTVCCICVVLSTQPFMLLHDHSLFMHVSQGIALWDSWVLLVAISNSLVLNLRRESGCGGIMTLTVLTLRRHPFLFPCSPPLLSLLWIRLIGLKFRWWPDCFGVRWFPKSPSLHPWGSSVRWVRCKSLLKFESEKLGFVHGYKTKGQ